MRKLTRTETLEQLLETLRHVTDPQQRGIAGEGTGVIGMPHAYHEGSYRELERCLKAARDSTDGSRRHWHTLRHRHLLCPDNCCYQRRVEIIKTVKRDGAGRKRTIRTGQYRIVRYHNPGLTPAPDSTAGRRKHSDAMLWLSREFRGEPFLPVEILEQVAA
jgi:hypothetical protein